MASIPKTASDISATWLEEALAERYPGVSVAGLELLEVRHGTNSHARFEVSYTGEGLGPAPPRRIFAKLPAA